MVGLGGNGVTAEGAVAATTGFVSGSGVSLMTSGVGAGASLVLSFLPNQLTGLSFFNRPVFFSGFGSSGCNATARGVVVGASAGGGASVAMSWAGLGDALSPTWATSKGAGELEIVGFWIVS